MKNNIRILVAVAVAAVAVSGFAALKPEFVEFGKGPATHIMTKEEAAQWKNIRSDAEAQAFIDLFWARRDPTPNTPVNEFREQFDARVKYADEKFAQARTKGSMTDRGKVVVILGGPSRIQRSGTEPTSTVQTPTGIGAAGGVNNDTSASRVQGYSPKQVWFYDQGKTQTPIDVQSAEIAFVDQYGSNEWKLERTSRTDYVGLFNRINQMAITQPSLTVAPVYTAAAPAAKPAMAAPAAAAPMTAPAAGSVGAFKTDALRTAIDEVRASKQSGKNVYVTYGEFITPTGDYFVPVQLYVPKVAGLSEGEYTFFGMVEDAQGTPAAIFEEPAKLTASKEDFFLSRSLTLTPGTYKGTFGIAQNGKPISIVQTDMTLTGLNKEEAGISRLILSNNIYPLSEAQRPTDPYAFGGIKVVPKSDMTFRPSDQELWYFYEIRNPGKDATSGGPKLKSKVTVVGTAADKSKVNMSAPLMDVDAQELKGVPGHYGVGSSIPLSALKPGDYTLKVKVTDTVSTKVYELEQPFKVLGDK